MIVGLGNPGKKFAHTRHNVGFDTIDALCAKHGIKLTKKKYNAEFVKAEIEGEPVILAKPLTYMNLSGEAVAPLMNFYKVRIEDLLVIYDDLDLPVGKIRLRQKGSAGGHNGMRSIIACTGTQEYKRLRIGIGRPEGREPVIDFVLRQFAGDDKRNMEKVYEHAADACSAWMTSPFDQVMNRYNR